MFESLYPDPSCPGRIPVVVIMSDDMPDSEVDKLLGEQWVPDGDVRPVVFMRVSEARSLAAEVFVAIGKLELLK
jgi:hypothetical protein